jgi:hypothetical protein
MCRYIEVDPAASASTSEKTVPVRGAISTKNTSILIPGDAIGRVFSFGRTATHREQTLEEEAWSAYRQSKPQFYEVCRLLADS